MFTNAVVVLERPDGRFVMREICSFPKPEEGDVRFYEDVDTYSDICRHLAWSNALDWMRRERKRRANHQLTSAGAT